MIAASATTSGVDVPVLDFFRCGIPDIANDDLKIQKYTR